jgi:GntR family transcriptional regulator / MocR family aminotransferase
MNPAGKALSLTSKVAWTQAPFSLRVKIPILEIDSVAKRSTSLPNMVINLDGSSPDPVYQQLYNELRGGILDGQLVPGTRLPSTRDLAAELGLSRTTVLNAFDQLMSEGYIQGHTGAGTFVSRALPEELLQIRAKAVRVAKPTSRRRILSSRGEKLALTPVTATPRTDKPRAFRSGIPALDLFPFAIWGKLTAQRWRNASYELLQYGDPAGYRPLREAIAVYLRNSRAVRCDAEQVIVVAGSQEALEIAAQVLLDVGDSAWVEDPGYLGARGALLGAGARLVPVPVDDEGLDVREGIRRCPAARVVCVSPSHQFPLGMTMSLARRLSLLEWASRAGAWILEDDYDSEYRYAGRPVPSLQGLDTQGRVIYIGTFSKVLFPSLRLGYVVAPPDLVDPFIKTRAIFDRHSPTIEQAVLTDFITRGHFARHIRLMRTSYAERQEVLVKEIKSKLAGLLEVNPDEAGMHLVGWLPPGVSDVDAARSAIEHGVEVGRLSNYYIEPQRRGALTLGYSAYEPREIRKGVRRLAEALIRMDTPI